MNIYINVPSTKEIRDEAKIQAINMGITLKEFVSIAIKEKVYREKEKEGMVIDV